MEVTSTELKLPSGKKNTLEGDRESLGVFVPGGFALEQLFSPRISMVVGAEAPLFAYTTSWADGSQRQEQVTAGLDSTELRLLVVFYTD